MTFDPKPYFIEMGKDKKGNPKLYLQVAHRLMWFRDEHPDWTLKTFIVQLDPFVVMCCEVIDPDGRLIATGHAMATATGGKLWSGREVEKAETAAQGRALAAAGFGTQFAEGFEDADDEHLADTPVGKPPKKAATARKSNAPVQRGATVAEPQEDAPESENLRDVVLTAVTVEKNETTGNRRMRFVTTDNLQSVFSWTRQPFITGGWCDERDWMEPNIYTLPAPAPAKVKWNATENGGYWTVESVDPFQPDYFNQPVMNASAVTHDTTPEHIDDPLRGELLDITRVEPRIHRGRSQRYQWIGHATFERQPITVLIFKEDEAAIREAGYDTSGWDTPDGRTYRDGGIALTTVKTTTGRQVASVWHISERRLVAAERAS